MFALSTGPTGRIFAFDVLPQNAAITKHNARLNRLSNIIARPVGLGEHPGPKWASFQNGNSVVTRNARDDAVEIELSRLDDEIPSLVAIMNDDAATTAARVRCAEFILDRAHGKPAYLEDPNRDPDFVPLAERLKAYVRRDQILAAEGKVVQILPPPKG